MANSLPWVASAVGLGFAYAALPGAVNAEALRRGVAGGFQRSMLVHSGALIGAAFWAIFALTGTSFLARYDSITTILALIGAIFLIRLTMIAIRAALPGAPPADATPRSGADFTVGIVVGIANPAGIPFWTGLASDVVNSGEGEALAGGRAILFVGGVLLGSFAWGLTLSTLISHGRQFLNEGFFRVINGVCAFAFGYFAIRLLLSVFQDLF